MSAITVCALNDSDAVNVVLKQGQIWMRKIPVGFEIHTYTADRKLFSTWILTEEDLAGCGTATEV